MSECKPLPDSAGYWIEASKPDEVVHVLHGKDVGFWISGLGYLDGPRPGRWLKLELPTFPPREKCPWRLCFATWKSTGDRQMFAVYDDHDGLVRYLSEYTIPAREDELKEIFLLTPAYLDELPHKDVVTPRVGT